MLRIRTLILTFAALSLLLFPASSLAGATDKIIGECVNDGALNGNYSQSQYSNALKNLPSDVAEYTDCADLIRRAQLADAGVGSDKKVATSSSGNSEDPVVVPASPDEAKAIKRVQENGDQPISIDGETVRPGASGFTPASLNNRLPKPLLIVLFLIAFGIISGALVSARAKYRSRN